MKLCFAPKGFLTMADMPQFPAEYQRLTYLVGENNAPLLRMMIQALNQAGAGEVVSVENGLDAWQMWKRSKRLQVLILSRTLPEMGGLDIISRIRSDRDLPAQPACIMVAAENSDAIRNEALDGGVDSFLAKPFTAEAFLAKVTEGLEARKQISGKHVFDKLAPDNQGSVTLNLPVVVQMERTALRGECAEISAKKCIVKLDENLGLGTLAMLYFPKAGGGNSYHPVKAVVIKTERIPQEPVLLRVHFQFQSTLKESTP